MLVYVNIWQRPGRPQSSGHLHRTPSKGDSPNYAFYAASPPTRPFNSSGIREPIVHCAYGISASTTWHSQSCENTDCDLRITDYGVVLVWHRASLLGHYEASSAAQDYTMVLDRSKADCQMQQIERPCHASFPAARHLYCRVYIWGYAHAVAIAY